MAAFTFRLDSFSISHTMAKHLDTDWVYFTHKIGEQVFGPTHAKIGDLNDGHYPLNWTFGPETVDPNAVVVMTYQIVNHGHSDSGTQAKDDISIATAITGALAAGGAVVVPPAAAILGLIAGALAGIGALAGWLLGDGPNCDGMVLSDAVTLTGADLLRLTHGTGIHTETRSYTGPETPHGCGADAQYSVGWSILGPKSSLSLPTHGTIGTEPTRKA